jgi:hypothetical protein
MNFGFRSGSGQNLILVMLEFRFRLAGIPAIFGDSIPDPDPEMNFRFRPGSGQNFDSGETLI